MGGHFRIVSSLRLHLLSTAVGIWAAGALVGCEPESQQNPLDAGYRPIYEEVMTTHRDSARNVRNKEARARKTAADRARLEFFSDPAVVTAIEAARKAPAGTFEHARGEAYYREQLVASAWRPEEKAEETIILARLEEARTLSASWTSPDGTVTLSLDDSWTELSEGAKDLNTEVRTQLAHDYAEFQMRLVNVDLQRLVELRNRVAARAGFANYWEMALAGHGLTPAEVDTLIEDIGKVVTPLNKAVLEAEQRAAEAAGLERSFENQPILRKAAGIDVVGVDADRWFDGDLAEERITEAWSDMGITTTGWSVFTGPSRYVRPGAFAFPTDPPERVALVMSIDRRWSLWTYEALAHEGAFAIWWTHLAPDVIDTPPLWGPPAPWFEGFAQFFERLVTEPAFTERYVPDLPADLRDDLARDRARAMLETINDSLVRTIAERQLYEAPENLANVSEFVRMQRMQRIGSPEPPRSEAGLPYDSALLSPILWNYPAYSPNFLFSYMAEAWIYDAVVAQVGDPVDNPKVGPMLVEKVIQGDPAVGIPERLEALLPGDRSAPLAKYLATAAIPAPK
jgi:hypothetical protein